MCCPGLPPHPDANKMRAGEQTHYRSSPCTRTKSPSSRNLETAEPTPQDMEWHGAEEFELLQRQLMIHSRARVRGRANSCSGAWQGLMGRPVCFRRSIHPKSLIDAMPWKAVGSRLHHAAPPASPARQRHPVSHGRRQQARLCRLWLQMGPAPQALQQMQHVAQVPMPTAWQLHSVTGIY